MYQKNKTKCCGSKFVYSNLSNLVVGDSAFIKFVPDHPLLKPLGFRKGKEVFLKAKLPFNGPFLIDIGDRVVAVSRLLSEEILLNGSNGSYDEQK